VSDRGGRLATGLGLVLLAGVALVGRAQTSTLSPSTLPLGDRARCAAYRGWPEGWPAADRAGMAHVAGGRFLPGSRHGYAEERPRALVEVAPFWIDRTEVTNAQFAAFVAATGHVTDAERQGTAAVFRPVDGPPVADGPVPWWGAVAGANWRHPEGPGSNLDGRANQPVVQVSQADALAYAAWLGHDLPTEAEWEFAARGGGSQAALPPDDGSPRDRSGRPTANFWQGQFPTLDAREDGFAGRAPVGCFAPGRLGLHDMIGNVWEWTRDVYQAAHEDAGPGACHAAGTADSAAHDVMVIKGGSFLCSSDFCARFRATARHPQESRLPTVHIGFRTVRRG
jgi:sulfatase modifying factor 1